MDFPADSNDAATNQARLLSELNARLEEAERLTEAVRSAIVAGDTETIESQRGRLETLAVETKVLVEELGRLAAAHVQADGDPRVESARAALERTATRLARASAVSSGLLERMVTLRRGLLATVAAATGGNYLPTGRSAEFAPQGLRLRQRA